MAAFMEPTSLDEMPPASVELDALSVMVEAYIAVEGREKGQKFLAEAARILALREESETVIEFLPPSKLARRRVVRRQTAAWFRNSLSRWIGRL